MLHPSLLLVVLCKYCISLNISCLQSDACDLTERTAFSIGSGSVKVRKYSYYSVQFRFALCNFEKYGSGSVKV